MSSKTTIPLGFSLTVLVFILSAVLTSVLARTVDVGNEAVPFVFFSFQTALAAAVIFWANRKAELGFRLSFVGLEMGDLARVALAALIVSLVFGVASFWVVEAVGVDLGPRHGVFRLPVHLALLSILIVAPLSEEILFRGFLQNMLRPWESVSFRLSCVRIDLAVVSSSLLFSASHLVLSASGMVLPRVLLTLVFSFACGLVFGNAQQNHRNTFHAVLAHSVANLPSALIAISP